MVNLLKRLGLILTILILATGIWYFFFRESESTRILHRLKDLAECISKNSGEKLTTMVIKSQQFDGFFAPTCQLQVNEQYFSGEYTPEQISANLTRGRQFFKNLDAGVFDPEVRIVAPDQAEIDFTGQLTGLTASGERVREIRELRALLRKIDGRWRFTAFKIREVLRK